MNNTCYSCRHFERNPEFPIKRIGTCLHLLDEIGHKLTMHPEDFCSLHEVIACHKEPEHGDHTNLWASMFELQSKVQDLGLKIDVHTIDESRHLRRPI
jgi:hypothetical protein